MQYVKEHNTEKKDHFPVFLMGNSFNNFVSMSEQRAHNIREMSDMKNSNITLKLQRQPKDSYLLHRMDDNDRQAVFNSGEFFNRQG